MPHRKLESHTNLRTEGAFGESKGLTLAQTIKRQFSARDSHSSDGRRGMRVLPAHSEAASPLTPTRRARDSEREQPLPSDFVPKSSQLARAHERILSHSSAATCRVIGQQHLGSAMLRTLPKSAHLRGASASPPNQKALHSSGACYMNWPRPYLRRKPIWAESSAAMIPAGSARGSIRPALAAQSGGRGHTVAPLDRQIPLTHIN